MEAGITWVSGMSSWIDGGRFWKKKTNIDPGKGINFRVEGYIHFPLQAKVSYSLLNQQKHRNREIFFCIKHIQLFRRQYCWQRDGARAGDLDAAWRWVPSPVWFLTDQPGASAFPRKQVVTKDHPGKCVRSSPRELWLSGVSRGKGFGEWRKLWNGSERE